jgi:hypothetical protein
VSKETESLAEGVARTSWHGKGIPGEVDEAALDVLAHGLAIVSCGINPGARAATLASMPTRCSPTISNRSSSEEVGSRPCLIIPQTGPGVVT